jgi:nucleoside 2-deoxyribosyltransferase
MFDRPCAYLAAPLFNKRELDFNLQLATELELYVRVFLPQRDGSLLVDMVEAGVPLVVAQGRVFEQDCIAMANADLLIAVLDGAHVDEGVAFEVGHMKALKKVCVGLQTDVRRALPTGNNPMLASALDQVFSDERALLQWVSEFTRTRIFRSTG